MSTGSTTSKIPESEGATGKAKEVASQVQDQVQEKAKDLKGQAAERARAQLDDRSTRAADQLTSIVQALRKGGEHLASEGNDAGAKAANQAADQTDRLAQYFSGSNAERLLADVERFARRKPWMAGAIGTSIGFMASRFLKASSEGRYQSSRQQLPRRPATNELPAAAADRTQ
jgi:ElaB/YqjD/DUF883 family membrane-anchored ribosome-binding protein